MTRKWLAAVFVLAVLASGSANADVIYTFFDNGFPSTVDLAFTVATQLSPANLTEQLLSTSGVFAADFVGRTASYLQAPPSFVPIIDVAGAANFFAQEIFIGFPFGNPANGVPGNGTFPVSGTIVSPELVAGQSQATISGTPVPMVPEPSSMILLLTGLLGLGWALRIRAASRQ